MKELLIKVAGAAIVMTVSLAATSVEAAGLRVNVPFAFSVRDAQMPAGVYTITSIQGGTLFVRGFKNGAVVLTDGVSGSDSTPRLVFFKYGERYVLHQVWAVGGAGRELPASKLERERRSAQSGSDAQVEQVVVPAF